MVTVGKRRNKRGKGIAGIASLLPGPKRVKVGFPAGQTKSEDLQKAIWQEFGTKGGAASGGWGGPIPERPFMREALRSNASTYRHLLRTYAREIVQAAASGKSAASAKRAALTKLGLRAKDDIQSSITSMSSPPNSPVTVALKGSSNPLIDTGKMRSSVTYDVGEG